MAKKIAGTTVVAALVLAGELLAAEPLETCIGCVISAEPPNPPAELVLDKETSVAVNPLTVLEPLSLENEMLMVTELLPALVVSEVTVVDEGSQPR